MPNLSQAALAREWKTSREYVRQCVNRGMVLDSLESCRLWRQAHASSRATTSPVQIAKLLAEEADDDSPRTHKRRKTYFANKADGTQLPKDTLAEALHDAIEAAREASRLLREAMLEDKDQKISVRIGLFNKASENRFKAETAYREELERRKILIPVAVAQDMARRGLGVIVERLRCLPQNVAPRCNPTNPHFAMEVLEAECNGILAEAQRVFADDAV